MNLKNFFKMHGLGNDFVIFPWNDNIPTKSFIKRISSRKQGVGCDLVVFLKTLEGNIADYKALFFNSDGSKAEICGNALRCVGKINFEKFKKRNCLVETDAGLIDVEFNKDFTVSVDLGSPKFIWDKIPLIKDFDNFDLGFKYEYLKNGFALNIGNPHLIFIVDKLEKKKLIEDSKKILKTNIFPEGVNISIVKIESKSKISVITNERGVGITDACGTGGCASVIAANKMGLVSDTVVVSMIGGDVKVEISSNGHIFMTGNATLVFEGEINMDDFNA
jgi:diaminopimelate epimerase